MTLGSMPKGEALRLIHVLCHLCVDTIKRMIQKEMVDGLPSNIDFKDAPLNCLSCVAGKSSVLPYSKKEKEVSLDSSVLEVGDVVASDTFGPVDLF